MRRSTPPGPRRVVWILLVTAATACAAPFVPGRARVPDEMRCLADIRTVRAVIDQLPPQAAEAAVGTRMTEAFRDALETAGFTVVTGEGTPRLALQFFTGTDGDHADLLALTTIIAVHQEVELRRLGQPMTLPVASIVTSALGERGDLEDLMLQQTKAATRLLHSYVTRASRKPADG